MNVNETIATEAAAGGDELGRNRDQRPAIAAMAGDDQLPLEAGARDAGGDVLEQGG